MYFRVSTSTGLCTVLYFLKFCSRHLHPEMEKTGNTFAASIYNPQISQPLNNILAVSVFKLTYKYVMLCCASRLGRWAGLEGRAVGRREAEDGHGSHVLPQVRRSSIVAVCRYTEASLPSHTWHRRQERKLPPLLRTRTISLYQPLLALLVQTESSLLDGTGMLALPSWSCFDDSISI